MPQISLNSLMANNGPSYPEQIAAPYREELVQSGFDQLLTPEEVENALNKQDDKITLVVLNSVCGCAARVGRPGAILSLFNKIVPDKLVTVFAGMEKDAVTHFRQKYLVGITPSSPNIALFKNGQLLHILQRHQIERMGAGDIAGDLVNVYDAHCSKEQSTDTIEQLRKVFIEKYKADPLQLSNE